MGDKTASKMASRQSLKKLVSLAGGTIHPFEPPTSNSLEATEKHRRVEEMTKGSTSSEPEQEEAIGEKQEKK